MSSQQCSQEEKEVLVELIDALKENRCLWDTKCEAYSNRELRSVAHGFLLAIFRKIQPNATVDLLKKKIDYLKSSFRREFKKVKASETTGAGTNQIYTPLLWFYDLMMFLDEKEIVREGLDTLEDNDNESLLDVVDTVAAPAIQKARAQSEQQVNTSDPPTIVSVVKTPIQRKRKISALDKKKEAMLDSVQNFLSAKEPEWEVIGKSLGLQLSQLDQEQQTIAHKLISDVIFYEKRQKLTDMSFISISPTSSTHTFQSPVTNFPSMYDHHSFKRSTPTFPTQSSYNSTSPSTPDISPSTPSSFHSESNTSVQHDYNLLVTFKHKSNSFQKCWS